MTGEQFKRIRMRFGATAEEYINFVNRNYDLDHHITYCYKLEELENDPVPERYVDYLRAFIGKETFNNLLKETEGAK